MRTLKRLPVLIIALVLAWQAIVHIIMPLILHANPWCPLIAFFALMIGMRWIFRWTFVSYREWVNNARAEMQSAVRERKLNTKDTLPPPAPKPKMTMDDLQATIDKAKQIH